MIRWARELVVDRTVLVYAPPLYDRIGPRLGPVRLFADQAALWRSRGRGPGRHPRAPRPGLPPGRPDLLPAQAWRHRQRSGHMALTNDRPTARASTWHPAMTAMSDVRLIPLGVGEAFTALHYTTCLALGVDDAWLLIDCPHPVRKMLREASDAAGGPARPRPVSGVARSPPPRRPLPRAWRITPISRTSAWSAGPDRWPIPTSRPGSGTACSPPGWTEAVATAGRAADARSGSTTTST